VLADAAASSDAQRIVLTSGKVYYDLLAARDKVRANASIIRFEQFYPFPAGDAGSAHSVHERVRGRMGAGRAAGWKPG
jgi:2-oxoglutarate dehydrogenase E1 component